jgi:hypothetical protein
MDPSLRTCRKIAPEVMLAACIHSCRATAARPEAITKAPCPAVVVFVRPSEILMQGTARDAGSAGRSLIGSTTLIWECRRVATSLRGLPPAANPIRRIPGRVGQCLWSRCWWPGDVRGHHGWPISGFCPGALSRRRFHGQTESLFDARLAKGGIDAFPLIEADQLGSRQSMVSGACGPQTLRIFLSQSSSTPSSGIPGAKSMAFWSGPQR